MKILALSVFLTLCVGPVLAVAAPAPPPPIAKLATAVISGANANDASAFAGLFTSDAVVVDENPPFAWRGAGAGVAWWNVVREVTQKAKVSGVKAIGVRTSEFKQSATDAYMIQAMTVSGSQGGKPFAEPGTMTYTFHKSGGTWLISSMVWTTKP